MQLNDLLSELKTLSLPELIDLYIEARKGSYTSAVDLLPVEALEYIEELEGFINNAISNG